MATSGGRSDGPSVAPATEVVELSYSKAGAELDAIIEEFETGVVDVDRLVSQLERATDIVDELDRRLRATRMRVEELVPRLEAIGRDGPSTDSVDPDLDHPDLDDLDDPAGPEEGEESPGLF